MTSADGTVQPIYTGESASPVSSIVPTSGVTGTGSQIDVNRNKAIYPTSATTYYHSNQVGSSVLITAGNGWPVWQATFLPFGEEYNPQLSDGEHYKFTGKERDSETGLDYFGARYYSDGFGRFITVDPLIATPLRIVNPQRWNLYAYAVNSPLVLVDPDGKDAAYVNFSGMANGFGHGGVLSIHSDGAAQGSATYSRFGPASPGSAVGTGMVQTDHELPPVQFGENGLPTPASLKELIQAVAQFENVDPNTVGIDYFKTSETDTWLLDQYILQQQATSDAGKAPTYCVKGQNCADYALAGLVAGHALESWRLGFMPPTPNGIFIFLRALADFTVGTSGPPQQKLKEKVTHRMCEDPECKHPL